jgi:ubiquinone/menaquinone biosynthesis C-methylase UbiE
LPFTSDSFDVAIMEWAGQVMRQFANEAVAEMTRVVRPGGRVIVTHRLAHLVLSTPGEMGELSEVHPVVRLAFTHADLEPATERFWGAKDRMSGLPAAAVEEQWLPRSLDELEGEHFGEVPETVYFYLTISARKRGPALGPGFTR